jgi:hypothetical protein
MTAITDDGRLDRDIACSLSVRELEERGQEFARLFADAEEVVELADGYAFRFPNHDSLITKGVELVIAERKCCPFFGFTLAFEANGGPVWLHVLGPGDVKMLIWELMVPAHLRPTVHADSLGT